MLAYAAGDARAFELLYARHRGWLHGVLLRTFNEDDDSAPLPEPLIERGDPAVQIERRQLGERVEQAVRRLPPLQREALLLAEWRDMSLEEIAGITGVPREAVKSRLRYARSKLAQWLADEQ